MIYVARYAFIAVCTVLWASVICVVTPFDRSGESGVRFARVWAKWILAACCIEVDAEGLDAIRHTANLIVKQGWR